MCVRVCVFVREKEKGGGRETTVTKASLRPLYDNIERESVRVRERECVCERERVCV